VCPGNSGYPLITTQLCDDAQDCVPDEEDGPPDGGEGAGGGAGDGPWIGAECGNSIVEFNEDCEQNVAFAASCTDFGFTGGTLQCTNCAWDTSLCTGAGPDGFCGDGIWQDLVEECEPGIPYPWTCEDLGYDDGITSCNAMCMVDGSLCYNMEDIYCGDGIIQPGEECDSQNFGDIECSDIDSFIGGVLQCGSDCLFYTELCQADCPGECGDDELNGEGEQCDGPDLGPVSSSCSDYPGADFGSGTITCNTDCTINLNNCRPGTCGDSILNSGEECDDGNKNDGDGCSAVCTAESCGNNIIDKGEQCESGVPYSLDCESLGFSGGGITCTNCKWNTSQCIDGSGTCGNNMVDSPGEVCDGSDLSGLECSDFTGYNSGSLSCNPDCSLNFSNCKYSRCRNGIIDPGESCEPDIALSLDCSDFGYFGGDVYCDPFTCQISTEYCDCVEGFCGDGTINSGQETCDGDDWGQIERCSQIGDFTGGSLSCGDDCSFDTTGCNFDNNCPVMQYVIITDPAYVSTAITAVSVGWTDLDADDVTPTYQYRWYRNGNLQYTSTDGASSVYTGAQQIGDLIEVRVRADDGECFGNEVSDSVTVQNMPPGVILTASPGVVTGCSGTVQLIATANDPDLGDTLAYRFDYESDGIWDTSFSTSNIISHSYSSYGQPELIYFATVEVSDGYSAVAASAQILVLCNSMNQACDQVQNLKAELDDDLQTINLSWTGGSLIDYYQICILGDMGSSTDLSSATRDFNCNYLGQGIFLPGSALNWQDTQAYLVPERYYKVRAICEYPGIGNQTNTSSKTVGKYEIPLYKPVMIPQNPVGLIKDKFSIPLNHTDMRIFKVLKSMGLGRGIDNAIWVSDYPSVCNQPDFSGNYSAAWQWDALAYLLAGKNQIEGFKLYRPGALCPYYQTEAFDLTDVKPGRYYEIELHEDEVLVNVGDVIISASVGLYTGIDVERKSPLGLTLPYDLGIQQALSDIGAGRGRNNSDYPTFPSCTGNSADNFIGNYSFVTTYDAPNGFVTYNPNMECPFYSAIDYIRDIMPGEGYLITMAENDTVTFNH
jgi:cysteine-rich repeat protein